ncbi:DUF3486 family protein [Sagittula sp. NFXS13]|uniref:phage protein Gp27 family protein n=1 Tax=Sagittula sp. NFXS13 TaxID=2819095 RepID=UPI0032E01C1A
MPPPKKIDLLPEQLREWLREELTLRGFGDILDVTEALNFRLEEEGLELSIGKSAVGDFSKALKDQREAFAFADAMLSDLDIEAEGDLHRTLMQMIATSAIQMMRHVRDEDGHLDPKDLMSLGRMLKDLMSSAGIREKLLDSERERIRRDAIEEAQREAEERADATIETLRRDQPGLSVDTLTTMKRGFLGLKS